GAHRAGHHRDGVQKIERAAIQVETVNVLDRLEARDPAVAVAHARVAGDCAHLRAGEVPYQLPDRTGAEDGVRVHRDQDIVPGVGDGVVERGGFAAVGLREE